MSWYEVRMLVFFIAGVAFLVTSFLTPDHDAGICLALGLICLTNVQLVRLEDKIEERKDK